MYICEANCCPGCSSPLTEPFIRCAECKPPADISICLRCFARGLQLQQHQSDHKYEVVKNDFQLFRGGWSAAEEIKLLDALADCGIGNWSDVANQIEKSKTQCERHYQRFYLSRPCQPLPEMMEADIPVHPSPVPHRSCEDPPRPPDGSTLQFDMSGYMAARGDFMVDHDNYAEMNLRDIEFSQDDDDLMTALKLNVVDVYQNVLRERQRRRRILRKHGLINMNKHIASNIKYDKTLNAITMDTLKVFRRLMSFDNWEMLLESSHYECELRDDARRLQEYRRAGLRRFRLASVYLKLKRRREEERSRRNMFNDVLALIQNDTRYPWSRRHTTLSHLSKGQYSHGLSSTSRKVSVPLDIVGLPGFEKLNDKERQLCASVRLVPNSYLEFKTILLAESRKHGFLRLAQARNLIKIDVNKTRKLFDFLIQEGTIVKELTH